MSAGKDEEAKQFRRPETLHQFNPITLNLRLQGHIGKNVFLPTAAIPGGVNLKMRR